ncbi:MAG: PorV/PorQ family protein [Spirochaetes bacterium]|nr:PorV/PorQ family protein [Spirochaetota bacterium]
MKKINILLFLLLYFFLFSTAYAGEYTSTSGAEILNFDPGARQTGLANSFVAMADDVYALFYNPGGLGQLQTMNLSLAHVSLFGELSMQSLAFNYPFWKGSFGAGFHYLHSGEFNQIQNGLESDDKIYFSNLLFSAGYGIRLNKMIYPGIGLRFLSSDIGGYSVSTFVLDAGIVIGLKAGKFYNTIENNLKLGLSIQNLGPEVKYISAEEKLPEKIRLGVSYRPFSYFRAAVETDYWFGSELKEGYLFKAGAEFLPDFFITPRLGFALDPDKLEFTFGLGVGSAYGSYGYRFDIAYKGNGDLGSNLYLALNLGELPFLQYQKKVTLSLKDFPEIMKVSASHSFKTDEIVYIKLDNSVSRDEELMEIDQEVIKKLREQLQISKKFTPVQKKEDMILIVRTLKKKDKYLLLITLQDKKRSGLKEYKISFKDKKVISRISKKTVERMELEAWELFYHNMVINSEPAGAELFINDRPAGRTPFIVKRIKTGDYEIRLKKNKFKEIKKLVSILPGEDNSFTLSMTAHPSSDGAIGDVPPQVFNLAFTYKLTDQGSTDLNQAFQSLFKENIPALKEYIKMDEKVSAHIDIQYTINKKKDMDLFAFILRDKRNNSLIKKVTYSTPGDKKLTSIINNVINEVMEYTENVKEEYKNRTTEYGYVTFSSLNEGLRFNFDNKDVDLPYSGNVASGEYKLMIFDGDKLIADKWLLIEGGKKESINCFTHYETDFSSGIDDNFWDKDTLEQNIITAGEEELIFRSIQEGKADQGLLTSKEYALFPFQMQVKLDIEQVFGSRFYFGFSDDLGNNYYICFNEKGYGMIYFKNIIDPPSSASSELITPLKQNKDEFYDLKIIYDGFQVSFSVDRLVLRTVPITAGNVFRIAMVALSEGRMLYKIKDFSVKTIYSGL